jgi:hypothetical protein
VGKSQGLFTCGRLELLAEKLNVENGELGTPLAAAVAFWP